MGLHAEKGRAPYHFLLPKLEGTKWSPALPIPSSPARRPNVFFFLISRLFLRDARVSRCAYVISSFGRKSTSFFTGEFHRGFRRISSFKIAFSTPNTRMRNFKRDFNGWKDRVGRLRSADRDIMVDYQSLLLDRVNSVFVPGWRDDKNRAIQFSNGVYTRHSFTGGEQGSIPRRRIGRKSKVRVYLAEWLDGERRGEKKELTYL